MFSSISVFLIKHSSPIETSQLICIANQMTGFYMRRAFHSNGYFKVWMQTLNPGPGPWTRTLKNLDPVEPGP